MTYLMDQNKHDESDHMFEYQTIEQMRRWFQMGGIKKGMKVLSVGPCNLRELCVLYEITQRPVIGVELDAGCVFVGNQTAQEWWLKRSGVGECPITFIQADVQDHLPVLDETVNAVVSIRVFSYLADPQKALVNIFQSLRPGGLCLVGDIDGCASFHDGMDKDLEDQLARILFVLRQTKQFDSNIGRQLYRLFCQAGFVDLNVSIEPYHLIAGKIGSFDEQHWLLKLETLRQIGERVLGGTYAYEVFTQRMLAFLRETQTFTYSMFVLVKGIKS